MRVGLSRPLVISAPGNSHGCAVIQHRHGHGNDSHSAWDTAFSTEGGRAMPALICMVAVIFAWASTTSHTALAQGTTIWTPGQPRTFVQPNGYGDATVFTPGQPRTFIDRTGDDSYTVFTPDGEIVDRQTYDYTDTRPRLQVDEEGRISVVGGLRRVTSNGSAVTTEGR